MSRQITSHIANGCNEKLTIEAHGQPGSGGANHKYMIYGFHTATNADADAHQRDETSCMILFQNGPIAESGVNGVTQEALLAIVIDRLQCFQAGPYACRENALALTKLEEAAHWLEHRTKARLARGIEGTHTV